MHYSHSQRTSFESACFRAVRDVGVAQAVADMADDEGAVEDLTSIALTLTTMLQASQEERRGSLAPKPIPGQTSLTEPRSAPEGQPAPKRAPRKARAPRSRVKPAGTAQ